MQTASSTIRQRSPTDQSPRRAHRQQTRLCSLLHSSTISSLLNKLLDLVFNWLSLAVDVREVGAAKEGISAISGGKSGCTYFQKSETPLTRRMRRCGGTKAKFNNCTGTEQEEVSDVLGAEQLMARVKLPLTEYAPVHLQC